MEAPTNRTQQRIPAAASVAQSPYFTTLSGLRGIAALAVVTFHLSPFTGRQLAPLAWSAVDLFFLLSGVVIETSYGRRLRGGMDGLAFLTARVVRLYPLYAISTLIMIAAIYLAPVRGLFANDTAAQVVLPNLGCIYALGLAGIPIWFSAVMYPLNQPAWSLFFELLANYLYAALYRQLTMPALLGLIGLGFGGMLVQMTHPMHGRLLDGTSRVLFSFFLGVLLVRLRPRGCTTGLTAPVLLLVTGAVLFLLVPAGPAGLRWLLLVTLVFPAIMMAAMAVEPTGIWRPLCRWLGELSYPVYLLHVPVSILLFDVLAPKIDLHMADYAPWSGFGLIVALALISFVADRYIDTPLRRALYRLAVTPWSGNAPDHGTDTLQRRGANDTPAVVSPMPRGKTE